MFKRKRKSLALKTRSVSSLSRSKDCKPKSTLKLNKTLKTSVLETGLTTPKNYSITSLMQAHKHVSALHNHTQSGGSFHFTNGFISKPKTKNSFAKIEKELGNMVDTLKVIRQELIHLRAAGTKIDLMESKKPESPIVILSGSRQNNPNMPYQPGGHNRSLSLAAMTKKLNASKSHTQLPAFPPSRGESVHDSHERAVSADKNMLSGTGTENLVKKLIGQLSSYQINTKNQSLEDFINCLSAIGRCKTTSKKKDSSAGKSLPSLSNPHSPTNKDAKEAKEAQNEDNAGNGSSSLRALRAALRSLFLTASAAQKKYAKRPAHKTMVNKGMQTECKDPRPISFANVNLNKTMEEMIKKIIIESKSMKYAPHSLPQYFETICTADKKVCRSIADGQKQSLFNSIYALLQKQLLVEVTLEMIKDSGVNVQNLFQFTFSRIGLDYDKYVQFENNRDQDLSAREIFEGELECSIEDLPDALGPTTPTQMLGNHFPLDFYKIQSASQEVKDEGQSRDH